MDKSEEIPSGEIPKDNEFKVMFIYFLTSSEIPRINISDEAIRRRLRIIPFNSVWTDDHIKQTD